MSDSPLPIDVVSLTRRMVRHEELAYREFHDAYCSRLSRYLFVVSCGNTDALPDVLQETFRRVVRHIRPFADEAVFWSWLTVLARTAQVDEVRKRRRYRSFLDRFALHSRDDAVAPLDPATSQPLDRALEQALATLDHEERRLIEAKYFKGRTVRDLAQDADSSEGAIESRLVRVRRKLKEALAAALRHELR
jgi:RNA polymerase sigma-70 factor (ECF subfamily)